MGHQCGCAYKAQELETCNLSQKQCLTNESKSDNSNVIRVKQREHTKADDFKREQVVKIAKVARGFLFRKNKWFRLEGQLLQYESDLYEAFEKKHIGELPSNLPAYSKEGWKEYYQDIPFQLRTIRPLFVDRIVFTYNEEASNAFKRAFMTIKELVECALTAFKGSIDLLNNKQGEGVLISSKGTILKGTWINNQFTGWNQIIERSGYVLIGNFINGKIEGKGEKYTFNNENGFVYRGEFVRGQREGQGMEISKGKTFIGEFKEDAKSQGKMTYDTGDIYEGQFEDDTFNGNGNYTWKNSGHKYVGEYKNGKFHGEGVYRWNENDYYRGGYKEGLKHGSGEIFTKNGSVYYSGPFESGEMHGEGHYKCGSYNGPAEFINGQLNKNYVPKKKNIFQKLYRKQHNVFENRKSIE